MSNNIVSINIYEENILDYRDWFVTQYKDTIQVSEVLCYKLVPIIYRTSLLQTS